MKTTIEDWKLTEEGKSKLSESDRRKYETAVTYKQHDWACGPWGGWVSGNILLKELGWKEVTREEGHRKFVKLVKP